MKLLTKRTISVFVLLLIATAFFYFISQNISDFKQLSIISPYLLIILISIFIFNYFLVSIITKNLLKPLGVYLKSKEAFALSIVTGFYNLITPFRGGAVTRAIYLKKKHNFTYTDFLASLAGMYLITFLIASLVGLITTILIYLKTETFSWILFLIFSGIFFPIFFIVTLSPKLKSVKSNFPNKFIKVINGWHLIKNNRKVILTITIISFSQLMLGAFMLYLQFKVFGIEIEFIKCLFLVSISSLAILIAITPAGLGISEAVTVFSALTIGITPVQSLSVALLGRVIQMIVLFILGPISSIILLNNKPKIENAN